MSLELSEIQGRHWNLRPKNFGLGLIFQNFGIGIGITNLGQNPRNLKGDYRNFVHELNNQN